jgi:hypothetical protein
MDHLWTQSATHGFFISQNSHILGISYPATHDIDSITPQRRLFFFTPHCDNAPPGVLGFEFHSVIQTFDSLILISNSQSQNPSPST